MFLLIALVLILLAIGAITIHLAKLLIAAFLVGAVLSAGWHFIKPKRTRST